MLASSSNKRTWQLALMWLAGCNFTVDADLTKNQGKQEPETSDGGGACEGLAGRALERCLGTDAGVPPCVDDCEPVVEPTPCVEDADCKASEICERAECKPRCDEDRGCAGPLIEAPSGMDAADGKVFWAVRNGSDRLGNPLHDGTLWSWDKVGSPVRLERVTGCDDLLFYVEGQLYFRDNGALFRVASDGTSAPTFLAEGIIRIWETPDHRIVWSRFGSSAQELWALKSDPQAVPELVGLAPDGASWAASNATHAAWVSWNDPLAEVTIAKLPGLEALGTIPIPNWYFENREQIEAVADKIVMDEKYLYFPQGGAERVELAAISNVRLVDGSLGLISTGDWLIWYDYHPSEPRHLLYMNDRNAALEPRLVADAGAFIHGYAVSGGAVYYVPEGTSPRIFFKDLPELPCAADLACPAEMSCGANRVCAPTTRSLRTANSF